MTDIFSADKSWLAGVLGAAPRTSSAGILSPKEWVESDYHVGFLAQNHTNGEPFLYPFWKEQFLRLWENRARYCEALATGAKGIGKTSWALELGWLRMLYELSMVDDPAVSLGLQPGTPMYMIYMSITLAQAERTGFKAFRNLVDSVPYFKEKFPRNKDIDTELRFPKNITCVVGSNVAHLIGTNLLSIVLDEGNFLKESGGTIGDLDKALEIATEARNRFMTRFAQSSGPSPCMAFWLSSASVQTSFTNRIISENLPQTMIAKAATWDVLPASRFSKTRFSFFLGTSTRNPQILSMADDYRHCFGVDAQSGETPDQIENRLREDQKALIVKVPTNLIQPFRSNPLAAMADLAGESTVPTGKFFTSRQHYAQMIELGTQMGLSHPFASEKVILSMNDKVELVSYVRSTEMFELGPDKQPRMKRHPSAQRFLHIDQATSGCNLALACCHLEGNVETAVGIKPLVVYDFMLCIPPPPAPDQIPLEKILKFILALRDAGVSFGKVTYDGWQSIMAIQMLITRGISAETKSVTRDDGAWTRWATQVYCGAVRMYHYEQFATELFRLDHHRDKRKVLKPSGDDERQDVADAVVACGDKAMEQGDVIAGAAERVRDTVELMGADQDRQQTPGDVTKDVTDGLRSFFPDVKGIVGRDGTVVTFEEIAGQQSWRV